MMIGAEPLAAVLQPKGAKSYLPGMFMHWFIALDIPGAYLPLEVARDDLRQVLEALPKAGFVGVHIAPAYQHAVLEHVDIITDRAALMSAANTIIFRKDGKLHADNTDGYGFIENLRRAAPEWNPKAGPAAIYGAGRAARVVVAALAETGAPEIRISSRSPAKANVLRQEFGTRIKTYDWVKAGNLADGATLIVNATPLGSKDASDFRVPLDGLVPGALACDLTFDTSDTRFLQQARAYGCATADGIGMMLCQAAPSFERWFGKRPPIDDAARHAMLGR